MRAIEIKFVQQVQLQFKDDIKKQYDNALIELENIRSSPNDIDETKYLDEVIDLFLANPEILTYTPSILKDLIGKIGTVPQQPVVKNGKSTDQAKPIKIKILAALDYTGLRNSFYPKYFASIGIKACVYCNSQFTLSVKPVSKGFSGLFDVDHYLSKHKHPWMSISLFNLNPSCAPCNRRKSFNDVEFSLYLDKIPEKSDFSFKLDPYGKAKFLISKDAQVLSCNFKEIVPPTGKKKFNDVFHIQTLYNTQVDLMEELMLKSQIYDENFKNILKESLARVGATEKSIERIILGNYALEEEIHKRPLSKFLQDLAKQLGLISESTIINDHPSIH